MGKQWQTGFTLYELLITVMIVAVILAFGIPNLRDFTLNNRMAGTANDLQSAFMMARTEAARAKSNVTICASADPMGTATCEGTWDQGYVVFVDEDGNGERESSESVLRAHPLAESGVLLRVADGAAYFMYAPSGLGQQISDEDQPLSQIVLCDKRGNVTAAGGNSAARLFIVTPLGRATIVRDQVAIGDALAAMNTTCP